ncbi:LuxR family two component transcriptional regulator [Saccharopolyspora dendranthemae]|uniref:LuxR family two component transcriptional regulator n=1 Tax=Saccharopolyspora dendranthemae TaxID=1181886 RepID=A0A561V9V3_9PSEU|nr:LuxR family two component transcriptional regulator [Saccharopolyspora dendranthemae]
MGDRGNEGDRRVTAVLIDDHPAVLDGIRHWCSTADPPIEVLTAGPDVSVAWMPPGSDADVVVLDLQLQDQGAAFADLARFVDAGKQVVVYTMRDDDQTMLQCLDIGAATFVTKREGKEHLVDAVLAAAAHRPFTPPALAGAISSNTLSSRPQLSVREREVLVEWFQSESKVLVAEKMALSVRTVNTYLDRVRIKYANVGREAGTKASLVARAIQDGLIDVDEL